MFDLEQKRRPFDRKDRAAFLGGENSGADPYQKAIKTERKAVLFGADLMGETDQLCGMTETDCRILLNFLQSSYCIMYTNLV